jgi:hypothetical protein
MKHILSSLAALLVGCAGLIAKPEVKQTSQGLEELAKLVAVAVEDEGLRNQIYARCMEKFDGETNVLWKHLDGDSKLRASGGGFSERIEALAAKNRGVASSSSSVVGSLGGVQAAVAKFEKTFHAPVHLFWIYPSNWDKKTTPLVAFVPRDVDPETLTRVPAFDAQGNRFELDGKGALAKQRPVIVVTFNERTTIAGEIKNGLILPNAQPNNLGKNGNKLGSLAADHGITLKNVTVTYPYNRDEWNEWDGAPEFQWDCFLWFSYDYDRDPMGGGIGYHMEGSDVIPETSGFFGGGGITNSNAQYQFNDLNASVKWRFCYWEDDGLFVFDDLITRHDWRGLQTPGNATILTGSQPSGGWFLPAEGGSVTATYTYY